MKQRLTRLFIILLVASFAFIAIPIFLRENAEALSGDGSPANPFIISDLDDFDELREQPNYMQSHIKLAANIDLSNITDGNGWMPLGMTASAVEEFTGDFDGDGYTITGLTILRSSTDYVGLFAQIGTSGIVRNLKVEVENSGNNGVVGGEYVGVITGLLKGQIIECAVVQRASGSAVNGKNYVGGLAGRIADGGSILNSYNRAEVMLSAGAASADLYAGGIAGEIAQGKVENTYSAAAVISSGTGASVRLGALLGGVNDPGDTHVQLINNFCDLTISGTTPAIGLDDGDHSAGVIPLPTEQMKELVSYSGLWNFNLSSGGIWVIGDELTYPVLRKELRWDSLISSVIPISTAEELAYLGFFTDSQFKFELADNIDLTELLRSTAKGWMPLAHLNSAGFQGSFTNSGAYTIEGLWLNRPATGLAGEINNVGLFSKLSSTAKVSGINITIDNTTSGKGITGYIAGALAGSSAGLVTNCTVSATSPAQPAVIACDGNSIVGGLIGETTGGSIDGSSSNAAVYAEVGVGGSAGGLLGKARNCIIDSSSAAGAVYANAVAGGLVAVLDINSSVSNSASYGNVATSNSNSTSAGGIAGIMSAGSSVQLSFSESNVSCTSSLDGTHSTGGLIGSINALNAELVNCYASGYISNEASAGTLNIGGIVGYLNGEISNCYFKGSINNTAPAGGIAGMLETGAVVESCYYDTDLIGASSLNAVGTPKTTAEMMRMTTYLNWSFRNHWVIGEYHSYPMFRWQHEWESQPGTIYISTYEELCYAGSFTNRDFELSADITLSTPGSSEGWMPIGYGTGNEFSGKFDGAGYTVSGLWINRPNMIAVGLFARTTAGSEIKDLNIEVDLTQSGARGVIGGESTGVIAGYSESDILNCNVTAMGEDLSLSAVSSAAQSANIGGLAGVQNGGSIINSTTNILVATNSNGAAAAQSSVGGLVGRIENCTVERSRADGAIRSSAASTALNYQNIGGLFGTMRTNTDVEECVVTGTITNTGGSNNYVGSLCGSVEGGKLANSYSGIPIDCGGTGAAGGLAGRIAGGSIQNCYYFGEITAANADIGGLLGLYASGSVQNSYYQKSLVLTKAVGSGNASLESYGKSPVEMLNMLTYGSNWDFENVWLISNELLLPILRWELGWEQLTEIPISTAEELAYVTAFPNSRFYLLNDIDLTEFLDLTDKGWMPIGSLTSPFTGEFNGNGFTINGLRIDRAGIYDVEASGFFGYISGGTVKDLTLNFDLSSNTGIAGNKYAGGITAILTGGGEILNCRVSSEGGSGAKPAVFVQNSTEAAYTGAIAAYVDDGSISDSYAEADVGVLDSANSYAGGLIGYFAGDGFLIRSRYNGSANGGKAAGGLIGQMSADSSTDTSKGYVKDSYAHGYANTTEAANTEAGGLIGSLNSGKLINCYTVTTAKADVRGGIAGSADVTESLIISCYFDKDLYPTTAINTIGSAVGLLPEAEKEAIEMKQIRTFRDWDFVETWAVSENMLYPRLKQEQIFETGRGTKSEPYILNSETDFAYLGSYLGVYHSTKHFELGADIDISGGIENVSEGWLPIGNAQNAFYGVLDGKNHTISGIWIDRPGESRVGLFGFVYQTETQMGTVKNLKLEIANNNGRAIIGDTNVGGLVGYLGGELNRCSVTAENPNDAAVIGATNVGGLCGIAYGSTTAITDSAANVKVEGSKDGDKFIGGFAGRLDSGVVVKGCYAAGNVGSDRFALTDIGGFTGGIAGSSVSNCYSVGDVTIKDSINSARIGGFVGSVIEAGNLGSAITKSYSISNVGSSVLASDAAAFIGSITGKFTLSNLYVLQEGAINQGLGTTGNLGDSAGIVRLTATAMQLTDSYNTAFFTGDGTGTAVFKLVDGWTLPYLSWQTAIAEDYRLTSNPLMSYSPLNAQERIAELVFRDEDGNDVNKLIPIIVSDENNLDLQISFGEDAPDAAKVRIYNAYVADTLGIGTAGFIFRKSDAGLISVYTVEPFRYKTELAVELPQLPTDSNGWYNISVPATLTPQPLHEPAKFEIEYTLNWLMPSNKDEFKVEYLLGSTGTYANITIKLTDIYGVDTIWTGANEAGNRILVDVDPPEITPDEEGTLFFTTIIADDPEYHPGQEYMLVAFNPFDEQRNGSGLREVENGGITAVRDDGTNTLNTVYINDEGEYEFKAFRTGLYKITLKDKAGNSREYEFIVSGIKYDGIPEIQILLTYDESLTDETIWLGSTGVIIEVEKGGDSEIVFVNSTLTKDGKEVELDPDTFKLLSGTGRYVVTVRAEDEQGNSATKSRTILIEDAVQNFLDMFNDNNLSQSSTYEQLAWAKTYYYNDLDNVKKYRISNSVEQDKLNSLNEWLVSSTNTTGFAPNLESAITALYTDQGRTLSDIEALRALVENLPDRIRLSRTVLNSYNEMQKDALAVKNALSYAEAAIGEESKSYDTLTAAVLAGEALSDSQKRLYALEDRDGYMNRLNAYKSEVDSLIELVEAVAKDNYKTLTVSTFDEVFRHYRDKMTTISQNYFRTTDAGTIYSELELCSDKAAAIEDTVSKMTESTEASKILEVKNLYENLDDRTKKLISDTTKTRINSLYNTALSGTSDAQARAAIQAMTTLLANPNRKIADAKRVVDQVAALNENARAVFNAQASSVFNTLHRDYNNADSIVKNIYEAGGSKLEHLNYEQYDKISAIAGEYDNASAEVKLLVDNTLGLDFLQLARYLDNVDRFYELLADANAPGSTITALEEMVYAYEGLNTTERGFVSADAKALVNKAKAELKAYSQYENTAKLSTSKGTFEVEITGLTGKMQLDDIIKGASDCTLKAALSEVQEIPELTIKPENAANILCLDIKVMAEVDGQEVVLQPKAGEKVIVKLMLPDAVEYDKLALYHQDSEGKVHKIDFWHVYENGKVAAAFYLNSFSEFVLYKLDKSTNPGGTGTIPGGNNNTPGGSGNNPGTGDPGGSIGGGSTGGGTIGGGGTGSSGPNIRIPMNPTGGTVSLSSDKKTVTIVPAPGYEIGAVIIDNIVVGAVKSYTFNDNKDHVVDVIFTDEETSRTAFADINGHWAKSVILYCMERGLLKGTSETTFEPELQMTRAMLMLVLYRLEGTPEPGANPFSDVAEDSEYYKATAWGYNNGIVSGVGEGKFNPEGRLTREQIAKILYEYLDYKGKDVTGTIDLNSFADSGMVSEWAKEGMEWAVAKDIIIGRGNSTLVPLESATRAEVTMILYRVLSGYNI